MLHIVWWISVMCWFVYFKRFFFARIQFFFFSLSRSHIICALYGLRCVLWLDKQKIENETKKKTERNSTVEVLEEQLSLWTTKVRAINNCTVKSGKYAIRLHVSEHVQPVLLHLILFLFLSLFYNLIQFSCCAIQKKTITIFAIHEPIIFIDWTSWTDFLWNRKNIGRDVD